MTVGQGFKKVTEMVTLDLRLRLPHHLRGDEEQEKGILVYKMGYVETRVNGSPECWGAIRLAVE